MNINIFFSILLFALVMIFVFFKPMQLKEQSFEDVPLFELKLFTLYELDGFGINTLMSGDESIKYEDRYIVNNINYTDNSQKYIANMKANNGIYKENSVSLNGDIIYIREDGLTFKTEKAIYNKKEQLIRADTTFISYRGEINSEAVL